MKYRKNLSTSFDVKDEDTLIEVEDKFMDLPLKGSPYYRNWDYRTQLDHLPAIYGILKRFEGKSFDEYYSYLKSLLNPNSVAGLHVASHAMDNLVLLFEEDKKIYAMPADPGRRWGDRLAMPFEDLTSSRLYQDEFMVDLDGIIKRIPRTVKIKTHKPKIKGFWKTYNGCDRYFVGPFKNHEPNPLRFDYDDDFDCEAFKFDRSTLPANRITGLRSRWYSECECYFLELSNRRIDYKSVYSKEKKDYVPQAYYVCRATVVLINDLFPGNS
ncbi:MAG: hypothetical protein ACRCXZ_01615 [Patescibacteria group bacterium]